MGHMVARAHHRRQYVPTYDNEQNEKFPVYLNIVKLTPPQQKHQNKRRNENNLLHSEPQTARGQPARVERFRRGAVHRASPLNSGQQQASETQTGNPHIFHDRFPTQKKIS